jgi:hypothetical protein
MCLGTLTIDCPACGEHLEIPTYLAGPRLRTAALAPEALACSAIVTVDREYLRAHWSTHTKP